MLLKRIITVPSSQRVALAPLIALALSACGGGASATKDSGDSAPSSPLPISSPAPAPNQPESHNPTQSGIDVDILPFAKQQFFVNQRLENQGLTYAGGFYYIGYDVGNGNGYVERYTKAGNLDSNFGGVAIPTRHTSELAYRPADGRLYAASGGGKEPAIVYRIAGDGRSVDFTYDFTQFGNSALIAIDRENDLLLLSSTQSNGDAGNPTFRLIDWNNNNRIVKEFNIPFQGIPQGLETYNGIIYYYTNNKITLLDQTGKILAKWTFNISGESEGLTLVMENGTTYLAVGYNPPQRIYTFLDLPLPRATQN
jgi:hypothetical protein